MLRINMEMPNSCEDCPMFDYSGDYPFCNVTHHSTGYNFPFKKKRMDDCPLSEEPNKDEDKEDDFEYYEIDWCYECGGLGDDYSIVDGELVCNCDSCLNNPNRNDSDD